MENQPLQNHVQYVPASLHKQTSKKLVTPFKTPYVFKEVYDSEYADMLYNNVKHPVKKFIGSGEDVIL